MGTIIRRMTTEDIEIIIVDSTELAFEGKIMLFRNVAFLAGLCLRALFLQEGNKDF